jgi:surfactin synthase thioesterase subunit
VTRLFCFAHAGGGAAVFRPWRARLGGGVDVRPVVLPGRESRWHEPAHARMSELVEAVEDELRAELRPPFALFGHSMGAALAYELTRRLAVDPARAPERIFVSGRRAPHLPARHPAAHGLPRDRFLAYLRTLNGVPPEVLEDGRLLEAFLPTLRADFAVDDTYAPPRGAPLPVPVSAFVGAEDPVATVDELLAWHDVTSREFRLRVFPGDHFYLKGGHPGLLAAIRDDLRTIEQTAPPAAAHASRQADADELRWASG